ncbi:peptidoglycan/xylan/chitin deacetylase (PgdA/CDA1 family) [Ochrobactrum daejeonense]|uniref:Peptidoglycan/xylan/chitin deacetylase (PgdA/CDA1 family) n=1 Tax=Brucella daejeonensis TaxID=659015 RepID=A0A7W9AXW9_9HYPH|nr:polysaccharide deacetylase [Brucella daejeonensis]MBB5702259.1 peptidoglycan/xylan/chitin deacetylase (PgdA/CDA1 family) [Brucella daejeonensis]
MRFSLPPFVPLSVFTLASFAAQAASPEAAPENRPVKPQYVLISFDGAHDNALWARSRELAKKNNAHFTYFLSCVFLMTRQDRRDYQPPHKRAGASNVGFALSRDEVAARLGNIWQAHLEGNEIASHGCGHFDGTRWSTADWDTEIKAFRRITADAYANNGIEGEPEGWRDLALKGITGFRAPYLAASKPVREALKANGFRYQASSVARGPELPVISGRLASFGLPLIPEGPSQRPIVAMDYNLYVRHSKGKEALRQAAQFEDRAYKAFRAAFDRQYTGARMPLQLGFHFVLMNDGAYWRAMERLVSEVCTRSDVRCTTYSDYLDRLDGEALHASQNKS